MSVELNESEATVGLEARLHHIAEVLEQRDQVVLSRVRRQISDIARRLPPRGLVHHHVIAIDTVGREVMVAKGRRGSHAHLLHRLLLSHGRLSLLVRPVAADGTRSEPLAIHAAESLFGLRAVTEGDEAVAPGAASLHVPHDTCLRHGSKLGKGLGENLVVDLVGQITHKDVEVT